MRVGFLGQIKLYSLFMHTVQKHYIKRCNASSEGQFKVYPFLNSGQVLSILTTL